MNIPYGRLHDIEYPFGSGQFVDIHCIFPDFDADENDPASYYFTSTDMYLQAMMDTTFMPRMPEEERLILNIAITSLPQTDTALLPQ